MQGLGGNRKKPAVWRKALVVSDDKTLATATSLGGPGATVCFSASNPICLVYTDPDGKDIWNNTNHWLVIRGDKGNTIVVKPNDLLPEDVDGILMHDGSTFKINDGNKEAIFIVSAFENKEGELSYSVGGDIKAVINHETGNLLKEINNMIPLRDDLEPAGMYHKGDDSTVGNGWWDTAMKDIGLDYDSITSIEEWDAKIEKYYKTQHPDEEL